MRRKAWGRVVGQGRSWHHRQGPQVGERCRVRVRNYVVNVDLVEIVGGWVEDWRWNWWVVVVRYWCSGNRWMVSFRYREGRCSNWWRVSSRYRWMISIRYREGVYRSGGVVWSRHRWNWFWMIGINHWYRWVVHFRYRNRWMYRYRYR